jgi:hypothetical protein
VQRSHDRGNPAAAARLRLLTPTSTHGCGLDARSPFHHRERLYYAQVLRLRRPRPRRWNTAARVRRIQDRRRRGRDYRLVLGPVRGWQGAPIVAQLYAHCLSTSLQAFSVLWADARPPGARPSLVGDVYADGVFLGGRVAHAQEAADKVEIASQDVDGVDRAVVFSELDLTGVSSSRAPHVRG